MCKKGSLLPLTTPCQGECNTGLSFYAARQYWGCESKDQCIKIQYVQDEVEHCNDKSDERRITKDFYSPIQWDKLTTCYRHGDKGFPGVKCSGQGVSDDCLLYGEWCNEGVIIKCSELGGRTSVHSAVCLNTTHWLKHPCTYWNYEGRRCNSEYSGQCYYPDSHSWYVSKTCRKRSHDIMLNNGSCPPTYFSCLVVTILLIFSQNILRMLQRYLRAWTMARREGWLQWRA